MLISLAVCHVLLEIFLGLTHRVLVDAWLEVQTTGVKFNPRHLQFFERLSKLLKSDVVPTAPFVAKAFRPLQTLYPSCADRWGSLHLIYVIANRRFARWRCSVGECQDAPIYNQLALHCRSLHFLLHYLHLCSVLHVLSSSMCNRIWSAALSSPPVLGRRWSRFPSASSARSSLLNHLCALKSLKVSMSFCFALAWSAAVSNNFSTVPWAAVGALTFLTSSNRMRMFPYIHVTQSHTCGGSIEMIWLFDAQE